MIQEELFLSGKAVAMLFFVTFSGSLSTVLPGIKLNIIPQN